MPKYAAEQSCTKKKDGPIKEEFGKAGHFSLFGFSQSLWLHRFHAKQKFLDAVFGIQA